LGQSGNGEKPLGRVAFGLCLSTDLDLPGAWELRPLTQPLLKLRSATPGSIADSWSGLDGIGWEGTVDGAHFVVERGQAGDHRFIHGAYPDETGAPSAGTRAIHHLSADAEVLSCAPANATETAWWRVVLDSVLFTVSLIRGYEALHAAAVAVPDRGALAITAPMGGGKSTLLSELLARGMPLLADDVLVLEPTGADAAPPIAHPAPPLATVPNAQLRAAAGRGTGDGCASPEGTPATILSLEDERWIALPVYPEPLPLRTLVVLDRQRGHDVSLTAMSRPLGPLLGALMHFPRAQERQRTRFHLASTLAATTSLLRLTANPSTPPDVLADLLLGGA
jgi:hypothetical protein